MAVQCDKRLVLSLKKPRHLIKGDLIAPHEHGGSEVREDCSSHRALRGVKYAEQESLFWRKEEICCLI